MKRILQRVTLVVFSIGIVSCAKPGVDGLRQSFAQQLSSNEFITDFQRHGDDLSFSGPSIQGRIAKWRVHIDSAVIEATDDAKQPYKGTVKSSWYADGQLVRPNGSDSNLPLELTDNGLAQDCWALWDSASRRWGW